MLWTYWVGIGSLFAALAVACGAFGAHALKSKLSAADLDIWNTAAQYQMTHAIALVMVGLVSTRISGLPMKISGISFVLGILFFSGSLYTLVLSGHRVLGAITPIGGVGFIVGWLALAWAMFTV
tara:strand:+ start:1757 stop:2128 length:372 start_codon:yes stop_codon:yes gene_type:complete